MDENPFYEQINALKEGKISEFTVEPKDFMIFREVWKELPDRMAIVGEAGLNGRIIYHYQKEEK